jgi:hypothetical protein
LTIYFFATDNSAEILGELTAHHLSELIDKVFNEYEEPVDEEVK